MRRAFGVGAAAAAPPPAPGTANANESEVDLMRTILGEHVPQSVILSCLNACNFDVTTALNWYFTELATEDEQDADPFALSGPVGPGAPPMRRTALSNTTASDRSTRTSQAETAAYVPLIQSGLSLTLHPRHLPGMVSKTDTFYATITRGLSAYDMLTPSNAKFLTIRLRKRGWRMGSLFGNVPADLARQRPYFSNGDVVTLECNGLWLKASQLNKMLQWKSPSDDERCQFVIRGLPLGRSLRPGDYFFLQSYKWQDKEIVMHEERPLGISSYNTSVHRAFLGLEKSREDSNQRLYFYAKLTEEAMESLPQPNDPVDIRHLTINLMGTPAAENCGRIGTHEIDPTTQQIPTEELAVINLKIDQMIGIVGTDVSRDRLANFLDGAGGNVQVALEHYFMTLSTIETTSPAEPAPGSVLRRTPSVEREHEAHARAVQSQHRRPLSQLILPVPSGSEERSGERKPLTLPLQPPPRRPSPTMTNTTMSTAVNAALDASYVSSSRSYREDEEKANEEIEAVAEEESLTIQDFEMLSVLGKGSFGAVMLVRFKKDGRIFAIKIIKKTNMDKTDIKNAMEERQILQRIDHPYICGLLFAFQTNERLYLGMKFYAAGDLFYHLNLRGRLDIRDARMYGAELVLAISYLHQLNILYRDLKPSNIMIDDEGHIGVVDFGLSKQHIYGSSYGVKTLSGTAEYVAPEALAQKPDGSRDYGKAFDWWSLGIVLYEMLVGESPFYDENEHRMLRKIAFAEPVFPSNFPREALDLVRGLLCKDPSRRLGSATMGGVDAIKSNVFFRGVDWNKLLRREMKAHWKPKLTSATDTRYVDPEFIDEGPPSAVFDPSAHLTKSLSKRFSQFSFNTNLKK